MSVADIVAAAQEKGLTIRPGLVYEVRRNVKMKRGAKARKEATPPGSIADFVRAHANLSPREIVAKAHAEGIKLNTSYVYVVRQNEKRKAGRPTHAPTPRAARAASSVTRPISSLSKAEDLLRAVAAEIGLGRAMEILQAERAKVRAVIGD
jgi:hypothetical protein